MLPVFFLYIKHKDNVSRIQMRQLLVLFGRGLFFFSETNRFFFFFQILYCEKYNSYSDCALRDVTPVNLTISTLWAKLADDKVMIFFLFFPKKIGSGISCNLSPEETICMRCQMHFFLFCF